VRHAYHLKGDDSMSYISDFLEKKPTLSEIFDFLERESDRIVAERKKAQAQGI
jgi:hypothetical protein